MIADLALFLSLCTCGGRPETVIVGRLENQELLAEVAIRCRDCGRRTDSHLSFDRAQVEWEAETPYAAFTGT